MNNEQWEILQQFNAHKEEPKYTKADVKTAIFCGVVMFYLICQVIRGVF